VSWVDSCREPARIDVSLRRANIAKEFVLRQRGQAVAQLSFWRRLAATRNTMPWVIRVILAPVVWLYSTAELLLTPDRDAGGALDLDGITFTGQPALRREDGNDNVASVDEWLRVLGRARYAPQPYQAVAAAYKAAGDDDSARRLLIAQQDEALRRTTTPGGKAYGFALSTLVGYGYRSTRAIAWLVVLFLATFAIAWFGWRPSHDIVPPAMGATGATGVTSAVAAPATSTAKHLHATAASQHLLPTKPAPARPECSLGATADYAVGLAFPPITVAANDPTCDVDPKNPNFGVIVFGWIVRAVAVLLAGFFLAGLGGLTTRSP
jgi:hypothetical protein